MHQNKMSSKKGKKEKLVLVFNEKDRREFLTGFRKRKNERRKKAKDELQKKEEERIKQARAEKREALRKQIENAKEHLDGSDVDSDVDDTGQNSVTHHFGKHTVTVSTITKEDMEGQLPETMPPCDNEKSPVVHNKDTTAVSRQMNKKKFRKKAQKRRIQGLSDKQKHKNRKRKRK